MLKSVIIYVCVFVFGGSRKLPLSDIVHQISFVMTFTEGAYLTFKSIFHKTLNLF